MKVVAKIKSRALNLKKTFLTYLKSRILRKNSIIKFCFLFITLTFILFFPFLVLNQKQYKLPQELKSKDGEFIDIGKEYPPAYIEKKGESTNPAIVLIHGFGGSTFSWRKNMDFFAFQGFFVVAIDLMGFGVTPKYLNTNYSHKSQAEYIYNILNTIGISKANFIGHSMGGNILAFLTFLHAELVEKIIFVSPNIVSSTGFNPVFIVNFPITRTWAELFLNLTVNENTVKDFFSKSYFDSNLLTNEDFDGYLKPIQIQNWEHTMLGMFRDSAQNPLPYNLSEINKRVLVIWGENDLIINVNEGLKLNAEIPDSTLRLIKKTGHLPMEEQSEVFNNIVIDFLSKN